MSDTTGRSTGRPRTAEELHGQWRTRGEVDDSAVLRFHGFGEGQWTDSAVRRYVTDAGPLLERLHRLTRADCTTRNQRKADRLRRAYDDLEERIVELQEQEELDRVRPELDGNQIAAVLGIEPGPVLGEAYRHLLQVRLDEGPIGPEAAAERLRAWWAERS